MMRKIAIFLFLLLFTVCLGKSECNVLAQEMTTSSLAAENADSEYEQMVNEIREKLREHESAFTVTISTEVLPENLNDYAYSALYWACEHTGNPIEGDYIRWNIYTDGFEYSYEKTEVGYDISISYWITYYTTKEQEEELTKKVNEILEYLALDGKSDYEKIFSIYNYVCQNVSYDWEGLDDESSVLEHSTYAALCQKKAVCQGYATAIYRLLLTEGIDCRVITGGNSGVGHGWNIVQLDGKYYLVDSTSDAENSSYKYFLKSKEDCPHLIEDENYATEDFLLEYPIAEKSYETSTQAITGQKDGFSYSLHTDNITILSYSGTDEDVVVPAEISGIPVKKIASNAFVSLPNLKTLTFDEGIENISPLFAYGCQALETIYIPSTACLGEKSSSGLVTGTSGFVNFCCNIKQVIVAEGNPYLCVEDGVLYDINKKNLIFYPGGIENEKLIVPNSVESVCDDAFAYHTHIKEVVLPDTVTYIGYWAFNNSSLEKINIPTECNLIGQYAFHYTKLKELYIPEKFDGVMVTNVFSGCPLERIEVEEGNSNYKVCDGALIYNNNGLICFASKSDIEECVIPDTVTYICHSAFSGAENIKHISIPDGIKEIDFSTFSGCSSLENIEIPDSVSKIEMNAFYGCENLKYINIPRGVKEIKNSTFAACKGLVSIGIPATVTKIEGFAFEGCESLKVITLPENITRIDMCTFSGCNSLENIKIPESVTSIGESAFSHCTSLIGINIPYQVTEIGKGAFSYCLNMTSVVLPYGINGIMDHTFYACSGIKNILIPETVTSIGAFAFAECTNLTSIIIPNRVTKIGPYALNQCINLEKVIMSSSVINIEECAFQRCDRMTEVYYIGTEENWNTIEISENNNYMLTDAAITYNYELEHMHNYIQRVILPTCIEKGYTEYKCNICGDSYKDSEVDSKGHDYGEWEITKNAGCIEEGERTRTCAYCNEVEIEVLAKTGHVYEDIVEESTCTAAGCSYEKCKVCGYIGQETEIAMKDHQYGDWTVTKEASCTEAGRRKRTCTTCQKEETEVLPVMGHVYEEVVEESTCITAGRNYEKCKVCGNIGKETEIAEKDHQYGDWIVMKEASCTEAGRRKRTCTTCQKEETEVLTAMGHVYEEVVEESTCTTAGRNYENCKVCGNIGKETEIAEKDHQYGDWIVMKEASCTEVGSKKRICTICQKEETEVLPAMEHVYEKVVEESTCTAVGRSYEKCKVCEDIRQETEIPVTDHVYSEWKITKEASCTETGSKKRTCTTCQKEETELLLAVGHSFDAGTVIKEPTEKTEGEKQFICATCNIKKTEFIPTRESDKNSPEDKKVEEDPKVGDKIALDDGKYQCTITDIDKKTVEYKSQKGNNAKTVKIPDTVSINGETYKVTSIAKNAFKNNTKIINVTIGKNITSVEDNAFSGCKKLKTVVISKNVDKIGKSAFNNCKKLKNITIKSKNLSEKNIGKNAFKGIPKNATIKVPKKSLKAYKKFFYKKGLNKSVKIKS